MNNWEYSESIESEKIVNIEKKYGNFIDGKFVTPKSKQYIDTISPSTEKILSSISIGNQQDVDYAVSSAKEGLKKWIKTTVQSER